MESILNTNCFKQDKSSQSKHEIIKKLDLFNSKYDCKICRKKLRYKADEIIHLKLKHGQHNQGQDLSIKCPYCQKIIKTFYHLKSHLMVEHLNERPYGCRLCKKRFHAFVQLKRHCSKHHSCNFEKNLHNLTNLIDYNNSLFNCTSQQDTEDKNVRCVKILNNVKFGEIIFNKSSANKSLNGSLNSNDSLMDFESNDQNSNIFTVIVKFNCIECKTCFMYFKTQSEFLTHIWSEHMSIKSNSKSNINHCWQCNLKPGLKSKFCTQASLIEHLSLVHLNEKSFKCSLCSHDSTDLDKVKDHLKLNHCNESITKSVSFVFACATCEQIYTNYDSILNHFKQNPECNKDLSSNELFQCFDCNQTFNSKSAFELHLSQHQFLKNQETDSQFLTNKTPIFINKNNIKNSYNNRQYSVDSLINSCKNRKPVVNTNRIDEIASKIISMKQQQLELEENLFRVNSPLKILPNSNNLNLLNFSRDHLSTISSSIKNNSILANSAFVIPDSSVLNRLSASLAKSAQQSQNLILQTSLYSPIQSMSLKANSVIMAPSSKCEYCGYMFKSQFDLDHHKMMHSSLNPKRPFKCHLCMVTFAKADQLTRHMIVHQANEQDFVCKICFSSFSRKQDLDRHMLFHSK